ncbi:Bug family tripartite tricarboxylate transporter substrate binding protein [Mesorhizobium sp. ASY16-5R]|jgi:tripartite-type tricarboxylate transporter receptor subunit TctC|uniref:Bug family tripartite tricarboxylate transporter substrate binding protein n=1 Tax=Mesorhizobium sp. ASY16-5R TaxID=3445772 RepID=UPI003F9EC2B4
MIRRRGFVWLLLAAAAGLCASPALAQDYPSKPITLVVPFAPGGATDVAARIVAEGLSKEVGQSVVVENRTGAAGDIGIAYVVDAPPDGYTLVFATMGTLTTNPHIYQQEFKIATDLMPISKTFEVDHVLVVRPSLGIKNLKDLIAYAKQHPGEMTYGSAGIGSSVQMFSVMLDMMAGTQMRQVPYKGSAEARVDVVAGNIDMVMDSVPSAIAQIQSGDLVPIAVTNAKRNASLPDVPTMIEAGLPGYSTAAWGALLAPAGTPQPVIDRLSAAVQATMASEAVVKAYADNGMQPVSSTPEGLRDLIASDTILWGDLVKKAGIKLE